MRETRIFDTTTTVYDIEHAYDKLGNRTWKYEYIGYSPDNYYSTYYDYDVHLNPQSMTYPTKNNRLLEYREYGPNLSGAPLLRTVYYGYFSKTGHVANITIDDAGEGTIHDLYLVYTEHGRLWLAVRQELTQYPPSGEEDVDPKEAWEFRYDSGRQRYVAKHWTIEIVGGFPEYTEVGDPVWTDYLGQQPYVDYTLDTGSVTEQTRYLAGAGVHAQQAVDGQGDPITYLHGDLTRSTMLTTDDAASQPTRAAYTAFGEPVTYDAVEGWRVGFPADIGTRYGYDGGWGYESGLITLWGEDTDLPPITLQHVGERWYQPALGRFVQRDPIGLRGGINVYVYCYADPLHWIDESGTGGKSINKGILRYGRSSYHLGGRRWVSRLALRWKTTHWYGWQGAWRLGGLVCIAAGVGYGVGTALDHWHPGTERTWHEHIGEWLYWGGGEGEYSRQGNGDIRIY